MNFWTSFMESERKHVECAFGILKSRFRVLKLPIRMCDFQEIDDMFFTCCILHNMCLDFDGGDDGWYLGDLQRGSFQDGPDALFSDDENHQFYTYDNFEYDLLPCTDYTSMGTLYGVCGSDQDGIDYISKVHKQAHNWYYMYRNKKINFDI